MKRDTFQSRIGFILVAAGCAIGIGNVWRFPYVAGQNGGGLFVAVYLLFLLLMGLPVLTIRKAFKSACWIPLLRYVPVSSFFRHASAMASVSMLDLD